jgi:hypothetical protein
MPVFTRTRMNPSDLPPTVREKWPRDLLREGFVPFPKLLLRVLHRLFDGSAEIDEIAALLASVDYRRPNLLRKPTLDYLAFHAGMPLSDFKAALSRLQEKGWLELGLEPKDGTVDITANGLSAHALNAAEENA